ncbi:hypothetical protein BKA62DRAFT_699164 [Auriculariales sp. MPI-PUGE-AT-0066]|nr:hypothetical protein BKA62DRAFT_699164 [Auriculariales sp. MPI-PUGE-AT-0066]
MLPPETPWLHYSISVLHFKSHMLADILSSWGLYFGLIVWCFIEFLSARVVSALSRRSHAAWANSRLGHVEMSLTLDQDRDNAAAIVRRHGRIGFAIALGGLALCLQLLVIGIASLGLPRYGHEYGLWYMGVIVAGTHYLGMARLCWHIIRCRSSLPDEKTALWLAAGGVREAANRTAAFGCYLKWTAITVGTVLPLSRYAATICAAYIAEQRHESVMPPLGPKEGLLAYVAPIIVSVLIWTLARDFMHTKGETLTILLAESVPLMRAPFYRDDDLTDTSV